MTVQKVRLLVLLTKREPPSSRLRFTDCLDEFMKHDIEPVMLPISSGILGRFKMLRKALASDVVIIQKKTSLSRPELFLLRLFNPALIFDMDDAVMFHEQEHRQPLTGKNLRKFLRTVNHCAAVVAGNRFLARFAEPNCSIVRILPTPIDTDVYISKDYNSISPSVCIGWLGVAGNLKYLNDLAPVFLRLAKKYPSFVLKIVSNGFIDIPGVPLIKEKWGLETEQASLRSFDIGIMPLDDSLWAWGKCGYKLLQYMGVAVPVVASPVGINVDFIHQGTNGYLASTHEDWYRCLSYLIESQQHRRELGEAGQRLVNGSYSKRAYIAAYSGLIKSLHSDRKHV